MKDLPHHIKKLNRNIIRSAKRETDTELPDIPTWPASKSALHKKAKVKIKSERNARAPSGKSLEERNKEMKKGRTPVFDRINNATPKHARTSKKKRPQI